MTERNNRVEYGDFQTPQHFADQVCSRLQSSGVCPDVIIEPTCGVGAFVTAAAATFPESTQVLGFDINSAYIEQLRGSTDHPTDRSRISLSVRDFFQTDWTEIVRAVEGRLLVLGNPPWVTSSTLGGMGGENLPQKSNFQGRSGFDSISGKANFDISEWMLIEMLRWFDQRRGDLAMLVKTAVARKVLSRCEQLQLKLTEAYTVDIDAKRHFNAAVDACLLVMRFDPFARKFCYDYKTFTSMDDKVGRLVGHRMGLMISDLEAFERTKFAVGKSPAKWRSGAKHDASSIMEFTRVGGGYKNGLNETVKLESTFLFPLLKGSDIGGDKPWREKFMLVTQSKVGEDTRHIEHDAPKTWAYLMRNAGRLDARGSVIYKKTPRFSVFGVGEYTFAPWKIAICGLYKSLSFRLIGPIEGRPAVFDDTVYYLSFGDEASARSALSLITSNAGKDLLGSLTFWDEKRPIKTSTLNLIDWKRFSVDARSVVSPHALEDIDVHLSR